MPSPSIAPCTSTRIPLAATSEPQTKTPGRFKTRPTNRPLTPPLTPLTLLTPLPAAATPHRPPYRCHSSRPLLTAAAVPAVSRPASPSSVTCTRRQARTWCGSPSCHQSTLPSTISLGDTWHVPTSPPLGEHVATPTSPPLGGHVAATQKGTTFPTGVTSRSTTIVGGASPSTAGRRSRNPAMRHWTLDSLGLTLVAAALAVTAALAVAAALAVTAALPVV